MTEPMQASAKGGLFEDLIEAFTAPSRVFERRRDGRYGGLLGVLMLLTIVIALATMNLSGPYWDAQFDQSMRLAAEKGQPMPEGAALDAARTAGRWFGVIGSAVFVPIFVWISALFVMLGAKVAGTSVSFRQGAAIFTVAGIPRLLSPIAMGIQGLLADPSSVRGISDASLGPARFFDPATTPPFVLSALANFDVINLWAFVVIAIGISVIGRVSRGAGFTGMAVVFACVLALTLIPAAFA
ncbi:MAG TPA: YIP1 family protein [Gemmatimonadaceae bacterium]|nr:YIP1 family protein [Gemmatimonadaceae bacterium]